MSGKWAKSSWGRKLIVQKNRASLNDFDRFKVTVARIKASTAAFSSNFLGILQNYLLNIIHILQRSSLVKKEQAKLRKEKA